MRNIPDCADLLFVESEIKELQTLIQMCIQTTILQNLTKLCVLSTLHDQQIVHFAYHGISSAVDPS